MPADLRASANELSKRLSALHGNIGVSAVYDPTEYAKEPFERYLQLCTSGPRRLLLLGMNPGPWGMAQTGVPFGAVSIVRNWMKITGKINKPISEHRKRPVDGWKCKREEVSGLRLWGLLKQVYASAQDAFADLAVLNYCPLLLLQEHARGVRNVTPDKLPAAIAGRIHKACDEHLANAIELLEPEILIGIGRYAHASLARVAPNRKSGYILHPSPASPAANRGFAAAATQQLTSLGALAAN